MTNPFFDRPVLNSPYGYPTRHWELDETGQPTHNIVESRRPAQFITPVPKPRKRRGKAEERTAVLFDEGRGLSTERQRYEHTALIDSVRRQVDRWRNMADPGRWQVTPETARLLRHWRSHRFSDIRPFFCQVEAVETAIWLTEVAPNAGETGRRFLDHLAGANDPYKSLKTTLKAEIDPDAWATLHSDTSRPFEKLKSSRIAVKVINHLGDEVMKVFRV